LNDLRITGKKLSGTKSINGAGRLTNARINTAQSFCGKVLTDNKDTAEEIAKATRAISNHYGSRESLA